MKILVPVKRVVDYNVKVRPLSDNSNVDLNNVQNNIDFLSLDTEGYELQILNGLDFNKWTPKLICVESHCHKKLFKIKQKLYNNNYILKAQLTDIDFLFEYKL